MPVHCAHTPSPAALLLAVLLVQDFCSRKAAVAAAGGSTEESETWTFMGVLFEEDARRQLLAKLGFSDAMLPQTTSATAAAGARAAAAALRVLLCSQQRGHGRHLAGCVSLLGCCPCMQQAAAAQFSQL